MISRRMMLRGLLGGVGAVGIGLPVLECMLGPNGKAYADGTVLPRRFGMFFWGNGNRPDFWIPEGEGEGDDWQLSELLMPLAPNKEVITVVTGTSVKLPNVVPHTSGAAGILTGMGLLSSDDDASFGGPTIDQIIAAQIGGETRFRSIEFGAGDSTGNSFTGPYARNPSESDPFLLFERIFGSGFRAPGDTTEVDPSIGLRRSVLDAVMADADRLNKRVGSADKQRIEQHLDGIRDLERRLAKLEEDPPNLEACLLPESPLAEYPDIDGRPQLSTKNRIMCDLVAMAFACDQTRVASNWFTGPVTNVLFPDAPNGHHNLTHDEPGEQPEVRAIVLQVMEELNYMVSAFRNIQEGDGTLLDNMVMLATSEVSLGQTHSLDEFPIILAGNCCGLIKQGIHYRAPTGENASKVPLSLIRAMGVSAPSFGAAEGLVETGLSAIEA